MDFDSLMLMAQEVLTDEVKVLFIKLWLLLYSLLCQHSKSIIIIVLCIQPLGDHVSSHPKGSLQECYGDLILKAELVNLNLEQLSFARSDAHVDDDLHVGFINLDKSECMSNNLLGDDPGQEL